MTAGAERRIEVSPGRFVGWESAGEGPGLVVLHGAGRARQHYRELAERLRQRFTVHLADRHGRGLSLPRSDDALAAQASDAAAVLRETGARFLFGHSAGGLVALAAARVAPVERLALYEPGVSIDGSFPPAVATELADALRRGDLADAQARLARAVAALPAWLPLSAARGLFRLLLASPAGAELRGLLPLVEPDLRAALADDGPASRFAPLRMPTLVMWGERGPHFLTAAARRLVEALPDARGEALPGQGHNAPDLTGAAAVAERLERFFGA